MTMAEYVLNKNRLGKTGISSTAILSLAKLSAAQISGVEVAEGRNSKCRIYGDSIKLVLDIEVAPEEDVIEKCKEVKEEIRLAFQNQLEIRSYDVRVLVGGK